MFQSIRALTVQKILKMIILSQKFLQNQSFFSFSLKRLELNCTPKKIQPHTFHGIIRTALNILIRGKLSVFYKILRDDVISQIFANED